ncbi:MAG: hypothetical protein R3B84_11955 [Zavarzinella sp.]
MKIGRMPMYIVGAAFAGWLCWLGYLAFTKTSPVVVSRAQMLDASHFLLVNVTVNEKGIPSPVVDVVEDIRPTQAGAVSGKISVLNIEDARLHGKNQILLRDTVYLFVLQQVQGDQYRLVPMPRAPGSRYGLNSPLAKPWVYVWNDEVQRQLNQLVPQ